MSIEVRGITKAFGTYTAVDRVDLTIPTGELVGLLGPSGSGKTTLLRIIAGLEIPDAGTIIFDGADTTALSVKDRRVGFVFQHYALFRHMSVFDNVAFGLTVLPKRKRPSKARIREKVMTLLQLVQIDYLAGHYPSQLSGGQRQRVALARALAIEPKVLLLDEPFGALDAKVRKELRKWLRRLHDELHITSVLVTHDQEEALEVSDCVVVMHRGAIVQTGKPGHVYEHPADPFVCQFLGNVNLFHARLGNGRARIVDLDMDFPGQGDELDTAGLAYVRPYDIDLSRHPNGAQSVKGIIRHIAPRGAIVQLKLHVPGHAELVDVELSREGFRSLMPAQGETVYATFRNPRIFAACSG